MICPLAHSWGVEVKLITQMSALRELVSITRHRLEQRLAQEDTPKYWLNEWTGYLSQFNFCFHKESSTGGKKSKVLTDWNPIV